jgi:predicted ATPase
VIQRTIERLDPANRRLLGAASVQGAEFFSSIVAEALGLGIVEVEDRLDALERVHGLVKRMRDEELPDRSLSVRYRFVHVLYQDALYGALMPGRKTALSAAIAPSLVEHYGDRRAEIASELALLLAHARDYTRAADAFLLAAQHALGLFANHEAIALAERGLSMLEAVPTHRSAPAWSSTCKRRYERTGTFSGHSKRFDE